MKQAIKVEGITWMLPIATDISGIPSSAQLSKAGSNGPAFLQFRHNSDTFFKSKRKMQPPSEPSINKNNPKEWFIYWNHDVPITLWYKYPRKRIRIKINDNINRKHGVERDEFAEERRLVWKYALEQLKFNPFEDELAELELLDQYRAEVAEKIAIKEQQGAIKVDLPEEDKRKLVTIEEALEKFMESRIARKLEPDTIVSYRGVVNWFIEGLYNEDFLSIPIGQLRHIHVSAALAYVAEEREWVATTINKGIEFLNTILNWLATEDYLLKNPSKGKFVKLPTNKLKHRWYDKETKKLVIDEIIKTGNVPLLRACEFTYEIMIRSKRELRKLQVGDIDRTLKRIRFRADLSKNSKEVFRDYESDLEPTLEAMQLHKYPSHFYVFGSGDGSPGITMCGHNYFSRMFRVIKDRLLLSMEYSIYGFKHTRIVHELMKGTDGYLISHKARHEDPKSTKDYQRDYDITLNNIYGPEDLKFY